MKINKKYLIIFFVLLVIEVIIALFVRDKIIRPYVGDILVVFLIYALIRAFIKKTIKFLPVYIFIFALIVELLQYFNIVEVLNLHRNKVLSIIIGNTFDMKDILCYFIGTVILIIWEKFLRGIILHGKERNNIIR